MLVRLGADSLRTGASTRGFPGQVCTPRVAGTVPVRRTPPTRPPPYHPPAPHRLPRQPGRARPVLHGVPVGKRGRRCPSGGPAASSPRGSRALGRPTQERPTWERPVPDPQSFGPRGAPDGGSGMRSVMKKIEGKLTQTAEKGCASCGEASVYSLAACHIVRARLAWWVNFAGVGFRVIQSPVFCGDRVQELALRSSRSGNRSW